MNWSDLRVFIAVAQLGSLRQAAQMLGVTQPTVARRIQELEADLGLPLFERRREGHRLTVAGAKLLPVVQTVETAVLRVEKRSLDLLNRLRETVRVEAGETAAAVLTRGLHNLTDGPNVELLVTGIASPIAKRTPEILVQHGMPEDASALTRRVGSINCAIYGAPIFAEDRTLPLSDTVLTALPWLGFVEEQEHYITMRWLRKKMRDNPPAARLMNTDLMVAAASTGVGVAVLPCFVGNAVSGLIQLSSPVDALRADYWIVTHPDLSRNSSVRTIIDWIASCFRTSEITGSKC